MYRATFFRVFFVTTLYEISIALSADTARAQMGFPIKIGTPDVGMVPVEDSLCEQITSAQFCPYMVPSTAITPQVAP